ncbi:MAG TPA: hypothetical protein VF791_12240 [Pyrinomonadaceae bacterium]
MISRHLIRSLLLILTLSAYASAQTPGAAAQTEEQRKARQELEHKALLMLDDVIKESDSFKQPDNSIRIKAAAAHILWKYDEARARSLFKEAIASLITLWENQSDADVAERGRLFEGPKQLRSEMLMALAQHDARLARELMRATRSRSSQKEVAGDSMGDQELQMDMNLAIQIASTDPKLAVEIGEEHLPKGFSYQLPELISAIREKDPEAAAKLAGEIMVKLRAEKLESSEARNIAVNLLRMATETPEGDAKAGTKIDVPLLDQATVRELTEMLAAEVLRSPQSNLELYASLTPLMPVVEKYAPTRAEQLRKKAPKLSIEEEGDAAEDESERMWAKYQPMIEKGTVDEILAAAPGAPQEMRDILYQAAAGKLLEEGKTERARQLVEEKIQNPVQKKEVLAQLDQAAAAAAVEQGKIEQGRKMLATLRTVEERAMLLAQLATGATAKGEKKVALQLLDEARGMISQRAKNIKQLGAQLAIARAYAPLDPSRSLAILEPVVEQLNELLGAATVLGGFFIEDLIRDDEIMLGPVMMLLNFTGQDFLTQALGDIDALARADFDRTKALADKFQREEIRTMARLLLAQSILSPLPQSGASGRPMTIITEKSLGSGPIPAPQ